MDRQLGAKIREARKMRGLSLAKLATRVGTSGPYLSRIERGEVPSPNPDILRKIEAVLDLPSLAADALDRPESEARIFVAIPSGNTFEAIYAELIKKPLARLGLQVDRAADLSTANDIMRDIIRGIEDADVVIADLTDRNPNVFYEIGLAHARERPVVMLTQDLEDIPFDLRQYRTIKYDTRFDKVGELEGKLVDVVTTALRDSKLAAGPYTGFRSDAPSPNTAPSPAGSEQEDDIPKGIFDYHVELEDAFQKAHPILTSIRETMQEFNVRTTSLTDDMNREKRPDGTVDVRRVHALLRSAAKGFSRDAENLRAQRIEYEMVMRPVEDGLERLLSEILRGNDSDLDRIEDSAELLRPVQDSIRSARDGCTRLAEIISRLPAVEREITRSLRGLRDELLEFAGSLDSTVRLFDRGFAVIDRAKEKLEGAQVNLPRLPSGLPA